MNEDEMKEAKIITLAIAKLREFCQGIEDCDECPLCVDKKFVSCFFTDATPNKWDADEALYRMAFNDGRERNERDTDISERRVRTDPDSRH